MSPIAPYGPAMQKMLNAFPLAKEKSNGWWSNDDNPTFDFLEQENGYITIHSWTGRTAENILALGGLKPSDIAPKGYFKAKPRDTLDLLTLAQEKCIHWHFLEGLGLRDGYRYKAITCVKIPYYNADGTQHTKIRVRKAISGDYKQLWDENTPGEIIPYGLQKLSMAIAASKLLIGEGESDAWACWLHGVPYLGIPGADMQKCLSGADLNLIPKIYILQEPDQYRKMLEHGEGFYKNVHKALRSNGYTGEIFCINFEQATGGCKDPSALHIKLWNEQKTNDFKQIVDHAIEQAIPANDDTTEKQRELSGIEKAIAAKDVKALFQATPFLAQLPRAEYGMLTYDIKEAFGKSINLNKLEAAVNEARKATSATIADDDDPDLDYVAQVFYERYADRWAYDTQHSTWRQWVGTHWQEPYSDESGKYEIDTIVVTLLHEFNISVKSNGTLDCVHRLARGKCAKKFTTTPDLVNFRNGTLHIASMEIIPHCKEDYMLYCLDYDYTPGQHPHITSALTETFCIINEDDGTRVPDYHAAQAYMAHLGLALIGDTSLHNFCVLYGARRAGKSTFLQLGNAVCGHSISNYADYAGDSLFSTELEGKRSRYVRNKQRLVCVDELSAEALRSEGIVKDMTAHSGVEMRGMNKDEEKGNQWRPKLLLSTNDLPRYKDMASALKERIIYISCPYTRPREERNPRQFEDKLLPELGAFAHTCIILAKAVLARWYYPQSIHMKQLANIAETNGNALKSFLEEYCVLEKEAKCPTAYIFNKLIQYREDNGHSKNYSKPTMVSDLKDMRVGIYPGGKTERYEGRPCKLLHGIRLRNEDEEVQDSLEHSGLKDDSLLMPICNDGCNGCNDHVTIQSNNRYIASNGSTGRSNHYQNEVCNDVTIKSENNPYRPLTPLTVNKDMQGIGSSIGDIESKIIVTSLQNLVDQPMKRAEVCNDTADRSLHTVTPRKKAYREEI